ncbi:FMN-binding negative transcriptional regulator [Microbacterium sp.]|uniref:FMN-binding negative transcriptional regulator n=1 Tax=Microbacterium sp. TaxID=51671 RepID=UPI003C757D4D
MWVNPNFEIRHRAAIAALVAEHPLATLVVGDPVRVGHMPLVLESWEDEMVLLGHVPIADPVARAIAAGGPLTAVFQGESAYVSPNWYADPGLPTYNFSVVHVEGRCEPLDEAELTAHLLDLAARLEAHTHVPKEHPWQPDDTAFARMAELLPRIIGFRLRGASVQAKAKLGQNRSVADRRGAAAALRTSGREDDVVVAEQMEAALRMQEQPEMPHACPHHEDKP